MPATRFSIELIQLALAKKDQPALLEQVYETYYYHATDLFARGQKCLDLLSQASLGEAVVLAEKEPKLIDALKELNDPAIASFDKILQKNDFAIPEHIPFKSMQELQRGLELEAELKPLLEASRYLALNYSPLKARLKVLRQIVKEAPQFELLQIDLRHYERERLREMQEEILQAERAGNREIGLSLAQEIEEYEWSVPFEESQRIIQQGLMKIEEKCRLNELNSLAEKIILIDDKTRAEEVAPLIEAWKRTVDKRPFQPSQLLWKAGEIVERVDQLQNEREKIERFGADLTSFEKSLQENESIKIVKEKYKRLRESGLPIPLDLAGKYKTYKKQRDTIRRWKIILLLLPVILVLSIWALNYYKHFVLSGY